MLLLLLIERSDRGLKGFSIRLACIVVCKSRALQKCVFFRNPCIFPSLFTLHPAAGASNFDGLRIDHACLEKTLGRHARVAHFGIRRSAH